MGAPGERKQKGGCCPPLVPAQRPHLGAPSLAAGHAAAPGGAGRRKRRGRLPPQQDHRGAVAPLQQGERGGSPPSLATHRGPGGPLAARGRRPSPAAPKTGVAPATPKRRGERWSWDLGFFVMVVGLVVMEGGEKGLAGVWGSPRRRWWPEVAGRVMGSAGSLGDGEEEEEVKKRDEKKRKENGKKKKREGERDRDE